jgi:hypothetical protein
VIKLARKPRCLEETLAKVAPQNLQNQKSLPQRRKVRKEAPDKSEFLVFHCALCVFAVKVLSHRHSYRKDANEDNNNFSAQDAIAMVALTARY